MVTIRTGSKGEDVKAVQDRLKALGFYAGAIDGDFGRNTKAAVVAFQQRHFVDGIVNEATDKALDRALAAYAAVEANLLFPVPVGLEQVEATFGKIEFVEAEAGAVEIVNDWAKNHVVRANLPVVGTHMVHGKMIPVFEAVLTEIADKGLDGEIVQFGVWSPRHKMHNPKRGLSTHSWAIACDLNWATNPVGKIGNLHPEIIESFERFGFEWGGRWRTRDDMHFQYCRAY